MDREFALQAVKQKESSLGELGQHATSELKADREFALQAEISTKMTEAK